MIKIDKTVIKETKYIAAVTAILSLLMQAVFLIISKWDYRVLLGNILGFAASVGNFLLMGITVQRAVLKSEKDAAAFMRASQTGRMFGIFVAGIMGVLLPCFNTAATLIPLFFPRIAIAVRPLLDKNNRGV